jgi:hypothetical protein
MTKQLLYVVAVTLSLAGCASMRGVDLGRGDTMTFPVEVTNRRGSAITVSYDAGSSDGLLGTVAAGRTERFIIPMDAPGSVTISATTSSGTSVGTRTVMLQTGSTGRVTFQ